MTTLNRLTLKDRDLFKKFLDYSRHELSAYSFENIYIWKGLFTIRWAILRGALCVFFQDKIGCFLYLPPLGRRINKETIQECFQIMDKYNRNKDVSRIENIEEKDLNIYSNLGLTCKEKYPEYLYAREDLAELKGDKFKAKRANCNYFIKHYQFLCQPFVSGDAQACLRLYNRWADERKTSHKDALYQAMLVDAAWPLTQLLHNYRDLNFIGRIVRIGGKVEAFSFGFKINHQAFCI